VKTTSQPSNSRYSGPFILWCLDLSDRLVIQKMAIPIGKTVTIVKEGPWAKDFSGLILNKEGTIVSGPDPKGGYSGEVFVRRC